MRTSRPVASGAVARPWAAAVLAVALGALAAAPADAAVGVPRELNSYAPQREVWQGGGGAPIQRPRAEQASMMKTLSTIGGDERGREAGAFL